MGGHRSPQSWVHANRASWNPVPVLCGTPENSHTTHCSESTCFLALKMRLQGTEAPKEERQSWRLEELSWGTENLERVCVGGVGAGLRLHDFTINIFFFPRRNSASPAVC